MIKYRGSFGSFTFVKGAIQPRIILKRAAVEDNLGELSPAVTTLTESADVLEEWFTENYRDLIDNTEFLDSSRVKRID